MDIVNPHVVRAADRALGRGLLTLVGAVLGVLQVALALQLILEALGLLRVLPGS